jgi:small GTP-binding protein
MEPARSLKVVFIGDAGVGKTSVISGKCMGCFQPALRPTLGSDHDALDVRVDGELVRLHVWDTAGQEMYNSLVSFYLRDCDVACIVASAADAPSIAHQRARWRALVADERRSVALIAVVNKVDLWGGALPALEALGDELRAEFAAVAFVSAKNYEGIDELFALIAAQRPRRAAVESVVVEKPDAGCC